MNRLSRVGLLLTVVLGVLVPLTPTSELADPIGEAVVAVAVANRIRKRRSS